MSHRLGEIAVGVSQRTYGSRERRMHGSRGSARERSLCGRWQHALERVQARGSLHAIGPQELGGGRETFGAESGRSEQASDGQVQRHLSSTTAIDGVACNSRA